MPKNYPYRPNVAMLVYRPQDLLLWLGERLDDPGHWQLPQGGVDLAESLEQNVIRELVEELGAGATFFGAPRKLSATHRYKWDRPREYGGEWFCGQDQTYWLVPFSGADTDLNLSLEHPEFQNFKWVTPEDVRALAPARRLEGYEPALKEFEALRDVLRDVSVRSNLNGRQKGSRK
jgi:putative (di)nucleoside polyphosphate hydrolase